MVKLPPTPGVTVGVGVGVVVGSEVVEGGVGPRVGEAVGTSVALATGAAVSRFPLDSSGQAVKTSAAALWIKAKVTARNKLNLIKWSPMAG